MKSTNYKITLRVLFLFIAVSLLFSCKEEPSEAPDITSTISVETQEVSDISYHSATLHGILEISGENQSVSCYGHCWGTDAEPAVDGLHTIYGPTSKDSLTFESLIDELKPGTQYNARAYVIKSELVVYSEPVSFTTTQTVAPALSTDSITSVTAISAVSGGAIVADGGSPVTSRGVVWGTSSGPTVESNEGITNDGSGTGSFSSSMNGLSPETTYYVCAYATNEVATQYGEEIVFTTEDGLPDISTSSVTSITATGAVCGGSITADGGFPVTSRGVVWGTSSGPTIESNEGVTNDGSGTGSFSSTLSGLSPNTTYYVCAYATNEVGTEYGGEEYFQIEREDISGQTGVLTDVDGNTYNWIGIGYQAWMAENLRTTSFADGSAILHVESGSGWDTLGVADKAYCWYDHSTDNRDVYGGLYTWAAAMNGAGSSDNNPSGIQGVCPSGWHLPSDAEWKELEMHLGMSQRIADDIYMRGTDEGGKLKATGTTHWDSPNTGATNESGFSALPGGLMLLTGYPFFLGERAFFWTATEEDSMLAWSRGVEYNDAGVSRSYDYKDFGRSVRCLRDQ